MHFCSSSFLPTWNVCTVEIGSGLHLWRLRMNAVGCQPVAKEKHYLKWKALPYCDCQWMRIALSCCDVWFVQCSVRTCSHENNPQAPRNFQRQMVARICPHKEDLIPDPRDLERKKSKSTEVCEKQKQEVRKRNLWIFRSTWRCKPIQISRCSNRWIDFAEASLGCFPWSGLEVFVLTHPRLYVVKDGIWRQAYSSYTLQIRQVAKNDPTNNRRNEEVRTRLGG